MLPQASHSTNRLYSCGSSSAHWIVGTSARGHKADLRSAVVQHRQPGCLNGVRLERLPCPTPFRSTAFRPSQAQLVAVPAWGHPPDPYPWVRSNLSPPLDQGRFTVAANLMCTGRRRQLPPSRRRKGPDPHATAIIARAIIRRAVPERPQFTWSEHDPRIRANPA